MASHNRLLTSAFQPSLVQFKIRWGWSLCYVQGPRAATLLVHFRDQCGVGFGIWKPVMSSQSEGPGEPGKEETRGTGGPCYLWRSVSYWSSSSREETRAGGRNLDMCAECAQEQRESCSNQWILPTPGSLGQAGIKLVLTQFNSCLFGSRGLRSEHRDTKQIDSSLSNLLHRGRDISMAGDNLGPRGLKGYSNCHP